MEDNQRIYGLPWVADDGGRVAAGFKGDAGDCVTRSIAIVTGKPYREVYDALNQESKRERPRKGSSRSSARTGIHRRTFGHWLTEQGYVWYPLMQIGSGCQFHLRPGELPAGRLVVSCSKHITAVIDGVVHDTHDPCRGGTRCVYGYWSKR